MARVDSISLHRPDALSTTNPDLIDLENPSKFTRQWFLPHGPTNPMKHEPCRLVVSLNFSVFVLAPKIPPELMRAHALFAGAEKMNRQKPLVQRNLAIFEDRADANREGFAASLT